MKTMKGICCSVLIAALMGCVTINIYFPEAQAEQAADRIIDEVRGVIDAAEPQSGIDLFEQGVNVATQAMHWSLNLLIPQAEAQTNFDASSPASRAIEQSLKGRFPKIKPHLDSGAVGLTAAGLLEIRDRNAIPLKARNAVRQLVSQQNGDWNALYKEIARINQHPEWVDQIRQVFASRWVAKASRGWYYRNANGQWQRK